MKDRILFVFLGLVAVTCLWSVTTGCTVPPTPTPTPTRTPTPTSTPLPQIPIAIVRSEGLNIRAGPGIDYPILTAVARGTRLIVVRTNQDESWLAILMGDNDCAWVSGSPRYVTVEYIRPDDPTFRRWQNGVERFQYSCSVDPPPPPPPPKEAFCTKVIDGDTIEIVMNSRTYRVRYIGIDTPEVGEPFYYEATEYNRKMVEGKTVRMEKDVSETDKYGRLLRYVYIQEGAKWPQINGGLVLWGWAVVSTYPPDVKYQSWFLELQEDARVNGRGIWGGAPPPPAIDRPPQPAPCNCGGDYYDCPDFPTQATAQACFDYCWSVVGYDVHWLDRDGDGIACEWNP